MNWLDAFSRLHEVLPITDNIARRVGEMRVHFEFSGCGIALLNPFNKITPAMPLKVATPLMAGFCSLWVSIAFDDFSPMAIYGIVANSF